MDDETLLNALRNLADELGKTPTRTEMNEHGPYSSTPYYTRWGSWNAALEAAGLGVNHRNEVSDEELIEDLQALADDLGRTPRFEDMDEHGPHAASTYNRRFGSWPEAKEAAGLDPKTTTSRRIDRDELVDALRELAEELGRAPTQVEMKELGAYSHRPYYREWDSWAGACRAAGLEPNDENDVSEERLIEAMQELADDLGYAPTMEQMRTDGAFSPRPYIRAFGTWKNAWKAAGLESREGNLAGRVPRDILLNELSHVADRVGRAPTRADMHGHGQYSHEPFVREFGSWSAALDAAGFMPYRSPDEAQEPVYYGANWPQQRVKALERDGFACRDCGMTDPEHREREGSGLHVHHIVKRREFDDYREANRLANLVTLCRQCHSDRERS